MPAKYNAVIADTSRSILLDKIEGLNILQQLFKKIIISPEIANEFGKLLPDWVEITIVQNKIFLNTLLVEVDAGEASALALATELQPSLLIIDELKGRKLAESLKLTYTGTLGILLKAKQDRIIHSLHPFFEKIKLTNFHISHKLLDNILKEAEE